MFHAKAFAGSSSPLPILRQLAEMEGELKVIREPCPAQIVQQRHQRLLFH